MIKKYDFLIIGAGIAGMSYALKVARARKGKIAIVCKTTLEEANTAKAQGGIASVTDFSVDNFEKHIEDTLVCGAGKCGREAVELVVRRAPELIQDLIAWGTRFNKTPDGRFELNREGGHTEHRILHYEDLTGAEIERALIQSVKAHPNITVLEHHFAIDLLTQHHLGEFVTRHTRNITCFGAYVLNEKTDEILTMLARFTIVATGGCGNIYSSTSNPEVATGDGVAMCHRAKAITENMQFIQEAMKQNRDMIVQLNEKLKNSSFNTDKLKKTIEGLQTQIEEQARRIAELETTIAGKDTLIAEQGAQINELSENVNALTKENEEKAATLEEQEKELNAAWFVFGTKSELKEQKILSGGDVLKDQDFNKDYFLKIDIRYDKKIRLYSKKSAQLLTTHPKGSYNLVKDKLGQYELHISDPNKFWSVSRYLVIQVK